MLNYAEAFVSNYGAAGHLLAGLVALAALGYGVQVLLRAVRELDWTSGEMRLTSARHLLVSAPLIFIGWIAARLALSPLGGNTDWVLAYLFVLIFGAAVGAAELVSRYKDRPHRAVATTPAVFYIALNAGAAVAALYLIFVFGDTLGFGSAGAKWSPADLIKAILLAGFSSLLFFRTSLFKLRVGESDLAVGPSIVLDTLLAAADRAVDRVMAEPRAGFVHELMAEVSFEKAAVILPAHCLALMQNVSSEEAQRITGVVNSLRASSDMPDKIKAFNLGLALLTVVGEQVLSTAVKTLKADLQDSTSWLHRELATVMAPVSFDKARHLLPSYSYGLWHGTVPEDEQEKLRLEMTEYSALRNVPDGYKALILGARLVQLTDGPTLKKAIDDLGSIVLHEGKPGQEPVQPTDPDAAPADGATAQSKPDEARKSERSKKNKVTMTPETVVPVRPKQQDGPDAVKGAPADRASGARPGAEGGSTPDGRAPGGGQPN